MTYRMLLVALLGMLGCKNNNPQVGSDLSTAPADMTVSPGDMTVSPSDMTVSPGDDLAHTPDLFSPLDALVIEYTVIVSKSAANSVDTLSVNGVASTDTIVTKSFAAGTAVAIEAQPGTNRAFVAWSGGPCDASTNPVCTIASLSTNVTMQATFANTFALTLTINDAGPGDKIIIDGIEYTSSQVLRFVEGSVHNSAIVPGPNRAFQSATYCPLGPGIGSGASGGCPNFVAAGDMTFTVTFKAATVYIASNLVLNSGATGSVTSNPVGINCSVVGAPLVDCTGGFNYGELVVLTAVPGGSSNLSSWSGCDSNPTADTCRITPLASFTSVTVTFDPK